MRPHAGALARICRAAFSAIAIAALIAVPWPGRDAAHAHEGHDHADKPAAGAAALASPRVVAVSESYQFVGIVEGEVLVVYLDRAADNAPVTSATIEVTLNGQAFKAEPQANGTYEVTAPILKQAGPIEVLATIVDAGQSDLLVGGLVIAASTPSRGSPDYIALWTGMPKALGQDGRLILAGLGAGLLAVGAIGVYAWRRRAASTALLAALLVVGLAAAAAAHDGHDHGADIRASGGNNPQRRPDGAIFLPKPTQRLLDVRTATVQIETATRAVRLAGRVAANPNFSGVVQSTIPGRYEAPAGGVPPLGSRVKAGDLMGRVAPSFASIDSSDMAQTLGDIDQRLSIARAKLARQEQLLRSNVVASALVDETRMEVDGLVKRRTDLLAARVRSEELRAPVDGIIAATRVVAGQVVTPDRPAVRDRRPCSPAGGGARVRPARPRRRRRGQRGRRRRHQRAAALSRPQPGAAAAVRTDAVRGGGERERPERRHARDGGGAHGRADVRACSCRARRWRRHPTARPWCSSTGSPRCSCRGPCARSPSTARPCW